jgi:hypothetical protein
LFNPDTVYDVTAEEIQRLVGESEDTAAERARCLEKLAVLEGGLQDLKRLESRCPGMMSRGFESGEEAPEEDQHADTLSLPEEEESALSEDAICIEKPREAKTDLDKSTLSIALSKRSKKKPKRSSFLEEDKY